MGTKVEVTLETSIDVAFDLPDKVIAHFIDSDWKAYFYTFDDLEEIAEHIALAVKNTPNEWCKDSKTFFKDVEGFGRFYNVANDNWLLVSEEAGPICAEFLYEDEVSSFEEEDYGRICSSTTE